MPIETINPKTLREQADALTVEARTLRQAAEDKTGAEFDATISAVNQKAQEARELRQRANESEARIAGGLIGESLKTAGRDPLELRRLAGQIFKCAIRLRDTAFGAGRELTNNELADMLTLFARFDSIGEAIDEAELAEPCERTHGPLPRLLPFAERELDATGQQGLRALEEKMNMNSLSHPLAGARGGDEINVQFGKDRFLADPKRGFENVREFFSATMGAPLGNGIPDNLKSLAAGSDEHGTVSDAYGGFLVPTGFISDVKAVGFKDKLAGLTQAVPMGAPSVKIPARTDKDHSTSVSGGLRVYRRSETQAATDSRLQLEMITLTADSLFGLSYATEELMSDSAPSFFALLDRSFREEFASRMVQERLLGTGVGQFLGVMNSGAKITVSKEGSQTAATILYLNLIKMLARVWGDGAVWVHNKQVLPQLAQMTDAAGHLIWAPNAVQGQPNMLLGLPMIESEYASALGTEGDIMLINFGEYLEGTLEPIQGASSMHVRFSNHERAFKFWTRNAGAPWWRSALTPKNGDTLSPIVTLETRS